MNTQKRNSIRWAVLFLCAAIGMSSCYKSKTYTEKKRESPTIESLSKELADYTHFMSEQKRYSEAAKNRFHNFLKAIETDKTAQSIRTSDPQSYENYKNQAYEPFAELVIKSVQGQHFGCGGSANHAYYAQVVQVAQELLSPSQNAYLRADLKQDLQTLTTVSSLHTRLINYTVQPPSRRASSASDTYDLSSFNRTLEEFNGLKRQYERYYKSCTGVSNKENAVRKTLMTSYHAFISSVLDRLKETYVGNPALASEVDRELSSYRSVARQQGFGSDPTLSGEDLTRRFEEIVLSASRRRDTPNKPTPPLDKPDSFMRMHL